MRSLRFTLCFGALIAAFALEAFATNSFLERNGMMTVYNTYYDNRFSDLRVQLPELKRQGIGTLLLYSPYHGDRDKWLGCAPRDFYSVSPQNGTLDELKALIADAHALNMKVVSYFANVYVTQDSPFFLQAVEQYRAGDRTSREVSSFLWAENATEPLPNFPTAAEGHGFRSQWKFSARAGAYFWSLWGEVGLPFTQASTAAELERITKFWLDVGLDGFMWDDTHLDPRYKYQLVDFPKSYAGRDLWITFESTLGEEAQAYDSFGLTSWMTLWDDDDINEYTLVIQGEHGANELESSLTKVDFARSRGKNTHNWASVTPFASNQMRLQEAALIAGAGITYGTVDYKTFAEWPASLRNDYAKVLAAMNNNKALWPSAIRARVATGSDPKFYAMKRTSTDGHQAALLIYNFKNRAAEVTVDLTGSGIAPRQTPRDLYAGGNGDAIQGRNYRVRLPAYGFRILAVEMEKK